MTLLTPELEIKTSEMIHLQDSHVPPQNSKFSKSCVFVCFFFCFLFFSQGPLAGSKSVYINPHTPILGLLFKTTADETNSPPHSSTSTLLRLSLTFSHPPPLVPSPHHPCVYVHILYVFPSHHLPQASVLALARFSLSPFPSPSFPPAL